MMIDEMRTLVLLSEEGSIQRVADRLPLTQPAVTRQIQRLEQAWGITLLDRRQKPPLLTPMGRDAVARCRSILAAYDEVRGLGSRPEPAGLLRLGLANGLAEAGLATIVRRMGERFPAVTLRLVGGWSGPLAEEVRRGGLDAAILLATEPGPGALGEERLIVIGPSDMPAPETFDALAQSRWVLSPQPCDARALLAGAIARTGGTLRIAAEIQDAGLQLALVRDGLGLGLMPERLARRALPDGIKILPPAGFYPRLSVRVERSPHLQDLAGPVDLVTAGLSAWLG